MPRRAVFLALVALAPLGGDWPQFRGPDGSGLVPDGPTPPAEWAKAKNVRWAVDMPGVGWASPVVAGGRVFLATAESDAQRKPDGPFGMTFTRDPNAPAPKPQPGKFAGAAPPNAVYRWRVYALDAATGKQQWAATVAEKKPPVGTFGSNGYASETPATDGERVYVAFGAAGVHCLDAATGKAVWSLDWPARAMDSGFGYGSSPVLVGESLIVQSDNEEQSFVAALDKRTGAERWRTARKGKTSWSSPFLWASAAGPRLVCCGSGSVTAYDPGTGSEVWTLGGIDGSFSATPVADAGTLFVGTGGGSSAFPLYAVRAGATGDISLKKGEASNAWVAWSRTKAGPHIASMLLYQGFLYVPGQRGTLSCFDAATGEPAYQNERLPGARGTTPSPWAAGGKVFVLDEAGRTVVVAAGPKFEPVGDNPLGEMCWATPAIADGRLYIRGRDKLYCITAE
jgi:outer membrane protein assembly factor BamB